MSRQTIARRVSMRHLVYLTDDRGILEHAKGSRPRYSHGYCTDDNARLLIVAARDKGRSLGSNVLAHISMQFLLDALADDGRIRNRLSFERIWQDDPSTNDCWGRAVWAFGTAVAQSNDSMVRRNSFEAFERSARVRSESLRSACFAALGAAEILRVAPHNDRAIGLVRHARDLVTSIRHSSPWNWPEPRLTYANAVIAETMLVAGSLLDDDDALEQGLFLLQWLLDLETHGDHLSVTPTTGRGPSDPKPAFDQQPIELATIADACARARWITGDDKWEHGLHQAVDWFHGKNDLGVPMINFDTWGGFDGLCPDGPNQNQGAESTLAMVATLQYAPMLESLRT